MTNILEDFIAHITPWWKTKVVPEINILEDEFDKGIKALWTGIEPEVKAAASAVIAAAVAGLGTGGLPAAVAAAEVTLATQGIQLAHDTVFTAARIIQAGLGVTQPTAAPVV